MIAFAGDMIFGDQPVLYGFGFDSRWKTNRYEGIFQNVQQTLHQADFVVANFESIIRERKASYAVNEWAMCCDDSIVKQLKSANVGVVSVANNHIYDFGEEAFNNTIEKLQKADIQIIGTKQHPYVKIADQGKRIAVIAATYVGRYEKDKTELLYKLSESEWKALCEQCQDCDRILAYVHWGNEYIVDPTYEQVTIAHEILQAGVDGIIGHHPHILQKSYVIQEKPVIFSLGNFFSDYWQERLRKTSILFYSAQGHTFQEVPCMIDETGIPVSSDNIQPHPILTSDIKMSTNEDIALQRSVARKETIRNIMKNLHRYRYKVKYANWVFRRVLYIVRYGRKEKTDPNIIYEKYKG